MIPIIRPDPSGLGRVFWDAAREHHLLLQRCPRCGHAWHPPAPLCPRCHAFEATWFPAAGRGSVHTFVVVRAAAHPLVESWLPYNVALVALEEGPRIVSTVRGCAPGDLRVGLPVELTFEDVAPDLSLPVFRPAGRPGGSDPSPNPGAREER